MNFNKRDALVGLFVVGAAAVFLALAVFVNRARLFSRTFPVVIHLTDISGIEPGVEVVYRGYRAGAVDRVDVTYEPEFKFIVHLSVKPEIRLRQGMAVGVQSKRLGAAKVLNLFFPEGVVPGASLSPGDRLPVVEELDLMAKANKVMNQVERFLLDFNTKETGSELRETLTHARSAVANLDHALGNANGMLAENRAALKESIVELKNASAGAAEMISASKASIESSAARLDEAMRHLPAVIVNTEELTNEVKHKPWKLLRKGDDKELPEIEHLHPEADEKGKIEGK